MEALYKLTRWSVYWANTTKVCFCGPFQNMKAAGKHGEGNRGTDSTPCTRRSRGMDEGGGLGRPLWKALGQQNVEKQALHISCTTGHVRLQDLVSILYLWACSTLYEQRYFLYCITVTCIKDMKLLWHHGCDIYHLYITRKDENCITILVYNSYIMRVIQ